MIEPFYVAITVATRPWYLAPVMEAWSKVEMAEEIQILAFCEPTNALEANIEILNKWPHKYTPMIQVNEKVLGALSNPHRAFEQSFLWACVQNYEVSRFTVDDPFVILAEDDSLPALDILDFFLGACWNYNSEDILAICAFSQNVMWQTVDSPNDWVHLTEVTSKFHSTIWGTWYSRWDLLDKTWDHDYSSGDPVPGNESGWDWNINLRVAPQNNMKFVHPLMSRSKHIGQFGGVHTTEETYPGSQTSCFIDDVYPIANS